jgi:hypothetical protein
MCKAHRTPTLTSPNPDPHFAEFGPALELPGHSRTGAMAAPAGGLALASRVVGPETI